MADYKIDYKISKNAKIACICIFIVFLAGFILKAAALYYHRGFFDLVFTVLFLTFVIFAGSAIQTFVVQKKSVISISSEHISVAVPYFFRTQDIPLEDVKKIRTSTLMRSEVYYDDRPDLRKVAFMWPFLSLEDRASLLNNIFELVPNVAVNAPKKN